MVGSRGVAGCIVVLSGGRVSTGRADEGRLYVYRELYGRLHHGNVGDITMALGPRYTLLLLLFPYSRHVDYTLVCTALYRSGCP